MSDTSPRGADPALLREMNAVATLRVLHRGAPMTLTKIVAATGLARRTAEAAVERLIADGLAEELQPSPDARPVGRPARSFQFRADAGYVLGLDIGVRKITALLADLHGTIRATSEIVVASKAGRSLRIGAALEAAEHCRTQAHADTGDVWATTAGTPGLVEDSAYVSLCHVIPDWSGFSLADELAASSAGAVVQVENDANLSAIAERWCGVAQDVDSMVWVLTGRRIKAAILIDGRLYRGADGAAGEIGWAPELGWSRLSEQTLSFTGIHRTDAGDEAATTIQRALAGDERSRQELDTYAASLAPGLTALTLALNPRCLVIGGGIAAAGEAILQPISEQMKPHCLRLPDLRMSTLGRDSVALGAVRHSLDLVERRLFSTERSGTN